MTATYTYPGVYLSETTSIPHAVVPATTNLTAVLGVFSQGPAGQATFVGSWAQFEATFGGLDQASTLASYAVWQFFLNGGIGAWIVRLSTSGDEAASATLGPLTIKAVGPGVYANAPDATSPNQLGLGVAFVASGGAASPSTTFVDLVVTSTPYAPAGTTAVPVTLERITAIPLSASPMQIAAQITAGSQYVVATPISGSTTPIATSTTPVPLSGGASATWSATAFTNAVLTQLGDQPAASQPPVQPALDQIAPAVFNLMVIPDTVWFALNEQSEVFAAALAYCAQRRAVLIVDPPPPQAAGQVPAVFGGGDPPVTVDRLGAGLSTLTGFLGSTWGSDFLGANNGAAAAYYPWVGIPDPANGYFTRLVPPSGTMAGVYAATDVARGVWKAPAGIQATLNGVVSLADPTITDDVNGELNIAGINVLRTFPVYGNVSWGARTLAGADLLQSPWKYVNVRRLTDYIEQSLTQSLRWAVFEPNAPSLWSSLALEATTFMNGLFAAGAFAGTTAAAAYSVTCDATTTSPADQAAGVVNIQVAFAPVKPAEFIVLTVQLTAAS